MTQLQTRLPVPVPPPRMNQFVGTRGGRVVGWLANRVMDLLMALSPAGRDVFARAIAWLAFTLGIRKKVAQENLQRAFPELSQTERDEIARGAYRTMARVVIESLDSHEHEGTWWESEPAVVGDWPALEQALLDGRGALIVTAHFGNWERTGKMLLRRGVRLNALVRPLKGALNTRIVDNRLAARCGLIYPKGAVQNIIAALGQNEGVMMLLDQSLRADKALFVPFFDRPASTTPAMALAAERTGAPVFVVMGVRDESGRRQRLEIEGPIPRPEGVDGEAARLEHTAAVTRVLERFIRRYPDQWLWLHRRWKVQPPDALPRGDVARGA